MQVFYSELFLLGKKKIDLKKEYVMLWLNQWKKIVCLILKLLLNVPTVSPAFFILQVTCTRDKFNLALRRKFIPFFSYNKLKLDWKHIKDPKMKN